MGKEIIPTVSNEKVENLLVQETITNDDIRKLIYNIRGKQVMLDSDVAMLYQSETKNINKTVRRNIDRFPENFYFQLTKEEYYKNLRFQFGTSSLKEQYGGRRYLPHVFTEQGIAMLSGLLKNEIAVQISISIMNAFIEMRRFLNSNGQIFERLTTLEYKQIENERNFDKVFNMLQQEDNIKQKIFFEGQIYDAYSLIIDIFKRANKEIVLIDNYINDSVLKMLTKKKKDVEVTILTSSKSNIENIDIEKFNKEYPILIVRNTNEFHDRFIIIDNQELYHCGASIKDLGRKCFAINRIEDNSIIEKIRCKV